MAFNSALVPLTATSNAKATVARSRRFARACDLHLDVTFACTGPDRTGPENAAQVLADASGEQSGEAAETARRPGT